MTGRCGSTRREWPPRHGICMKRRFCERLPDPCASCISPTRCCPAGTTATRISSVACCASCSRAATGPQLGAGGQLEPAEPAAGAAGAATLDLFATTSPSWPPVVSFLHPDLDAMLDGADVVLVHEWNDPTWSPRSAGNGSRAAAFQLLFHDTHHRAVSDPEAIRHFDLNGYDGVLAFGATLADVYAGWGWGQAACSSGTKPPTLRLFQPPAESSRRARAGSGSATGATASVAPNSRSSCWPRQSDAGLPLDIYGVRYPDTALANLAAAGATTRLARQSTRAGGVRPPSSMTVHVPRRFYVTLLPGIPTIRVFEALACGIPLRRRRGTTRRACSGPGEDYLVARDGADMTRLRARRRARMPDCARRWCSAASRRSAPATPAPTARRAAGHRRHAARKPQELAA